MASRALTLLLVVLASSPAAARADERLAPAPGGVNLTAGSGFAAWAEPAEDTGWVLVVRAPDGTVSRPAIAGFPGPPDADIGAGGALASSVPTVVAVYARPSGGDLDLYELDMHTGRERRIAAVSSASADEVSPSVMRGRLAFVRRGGRAPGVHVWSGSGRPRRISPTVASQTASNGSRVAYATAGSVTVRKGSGRGAVTRFRTSSRPLSLGLGQYRVSWLQRDGRVRRSDRVAVSAGTRVLETSTRTLPAATQSIAAEARDTSLYLGPSGLQRISPALKYDD